jgi:hypothetical protein
MGSRASDTAKGALGGAATGATIGSVVPGYGTAIGAGIGGLIGGIGGYFSHHDDAPAQYQDRDRILSLINGGFGQGGGRLGNGQPIRVGGVDVSGVGGAFGGGGAQNITGYDAPRVSSASPFRTGQLAQMQQLQGIASGQQQGAGELAAQRQVQNALAAQQAQARMARGGGMAPMAYRNAANQSAALGISGAGMGQQSALQDQQAAQNQLASVSSAGRNADISIGNANAGYQLQNNQLNSQNYKDLLAQLTAMNAGTFAAQNANNMAQNQQNNALLGAGIQTAGTIIASRK